MVMACTAFTPRYSVFTIFFNMVHSKHQQEWLELMIDSHIYKCLLEYSLQ